MFLFCRWWNWSWGRQIARMDRGSGHSHLRHSRRLRNCLQWLYEGETISRSAEPDRRRAQIRRPQRRWKSPNLRRRNRRRRYLSGKGGNGNISIAANGDWSILCFCCPTLASHHIGRGAYRSAPLFSERSLCLIDIDFVVHLLTSNLIWIRWFAILVLPTSNLSRNYTFWTATHSERFTYARARAQGLRRNFEMETI